MADQISLTIPLTRSALTRSAEMLRSLAEDLDEEEEVLFPGTEITHAPEVSNTAPPPPIELDSDQLPWDVRIHSSSKSTLAKTGQWKKRRGIDLALVSQVETELHAAIAIPPVTTAEAIDTFPKIMTAITASGLDPDTVQVAVAKAGLVSLPLLATRPDLIPIVAADLGL